MDHIRQTARHNMLYNMGTQRKAHGPNVARQKFENGTQAIYWMQSMLVKVNWSSDLSTDNMMQLKACLYL